MLKSREKEIQGRTEKAYVGPWERKGVFPDAHGIHAYRKWITGFGIEAKANADFIAHSRADIPYLLDTVGRLRGLLGEARDWTFCVAAGDLPHRIDAELEGCDAD